MLGEQDYYTILEVPRDASDAEIRRAFRTLAKEHHPDRRKGDSGGAAGRDFRLLTEAYETLKDPARRAAYNEELDQARELSEARSKRRPRAFAAGLAAGLILVFVAVGAFVYLDRSSRTNGDKAQDSLKGVTVAESIAETEQKIQLDSNDSAPEATARISSPSDAASGISRAVSLPKLSTPNLSRTAAPAAPAAELQPAPLPKDPAGKTPGNAAQNRQSGGLIEISAGRPGQVKTIRLEPGRGQTQGFTDCANCPEMVVIPAGEAVMGSRPESDGYRFEEAPAHRIRIAKPLAVSKYAISAGNWRACVDAGVCRLTLSSLLAVGPRVAATRLSWFDAKAYVEWLSQTSGWRYRLLTEAEWEYVARAGKGTPSAPDTVRDRYALDALKTTGNPVPRVGPDQVSASGPNAWGVQGGGLLEWVEDCWHPSYDQAPGDASPWLSVGDGDCSYRVVRGSDKSLGGFGARPSSRAREFADISAPTLGFRVARELSAPAKTALGGN